MRCEMCGRGRRREQKRTEGGFALSRSSFLHSSQPAQSHADESLNERLSCEGMAAESGSFSGAAADNTAQRAEEEPVSNPASLNVLDSARFAAQACG